MLSGSFYLKPLKVRLLAGDPGAQNSVPSRWPGFQEVVRAVWAQIAPGLAEAGEIGP